MLSFVGVSRGLAFLLAGGIALSACGGGSSNSSPLPVASATPTPTPSPSPTSGFSAAAYTCPTSDTAASVARSSAGSVSGFGASSESIRRSTPRKAAAVVSAGATATQLLAITYDARVATAARVAVSARESSLGTPLSGDFSFPHAGLITHVLAVPAARVAGVESTLRSTAGVRSVGLTGNRRYPTSVTTPYFPNDPYFTGFSITTAPTSGGTPPPATFGVGPLEESPDVPGQWDMHATRLEYALGYSQPNNGSGIVNSGALGSSSVKIAIIDTGEDATHPELQSKIAYQHCFITNPNGSQSSSGFTTDPDGHGTNVAGIAGAASNNALGFAGAGGNVELYGYRVFPTPDDNCTDPASTDKQCGTDTRDIASAIEDAVSKHVNVISMSLGGNPCNTDGSDSDPIEGNAVADAIAANIIVVAAAGNSSGPPVEAPGCDPGVIAVGATARADGTTNGSGTSGGSASSPFEYVASYTDYGTPGAAVNSSSAWGIVAPGGDPNCPGASTTPCTDTDDFHWIENLWTSQPFDSKFAGSCGGDYENDTGTVDCRILIAGTSMATPHVAGAAALILSVNSSYQSPARMKQLLCQTADDISDPNEGCGRLDVYRAMATALGDSAPPGANPIP